MSHVFFGGQKVLLRKCAPGVVGEHLAFVRDRYGAGPFTVVSVHSVPDKSRRVVSHPQWVELDISKDRHHLFSGAFFEPAPE